jgi:hypothetical protein
MRAVRLTGPVDIDGLTVSNVPVPEVRPGWVRIQVRAFGVNESEATSRQGESGSDFTFPRILGIEAVGVIDAVGDGVDLEPGQKVATMMGGLGRTIDGSYAEYTVVDAANVIPFDTDLGWDVVGGLPEMLQTAHGAITTALALNPGHASMRQCVGRDRALAGLTLVRSHSTKSRTSTRCARFHGTFTAAEKRYQRSRSYAYDRHDDVPFPHASSSRRNSLTGSIATPAPSSTIHGKSTAQVGWTAPLRATTSPATERPPPSPSMSAAIDAAPQVRARGHQRQRRHHAFRGRHASSAVNKTCRGP